MLLLMSMLENEQERLSFQQIYQQNYRTMYYVAMGILKNPQEAEDAVHSSFVKLAEKFGKYSRLSCSEMTSLCVIIVKNKSLDMKKVSRSSTQCGLEKVEFSIETAEKEPLQALVEREEAEALSEALRCLPEGLRMVLELKYFHEYSNSEIADILDISKKNVEIRLYRAKKRMKEVLQGEGRWQTV